MEAKSSTQRVRFFTFTCQLHEICYYEFEIFYDQNIANLPQNANEKVRFLKNVRNRVFQRKIVF